MLYLTNNNDNTNKFEEEGRHINMICIMLYCTHTRVTCNLITIIIFINVRIETIIFYLLYNV